MSCEVTCKALLVITTKASSVAAVAKSLDLFLCQQGMKERYFAGVLWMLLEILHDLVVLNSHISQGLGPLDHAGF